METTLEEVRAACTDLERLGQDLISSPSPQQADAIQSKCRQYKTRMRGRYGNVGEQLGRLSEAVAKYKTQRVDHDHASGEVLTVLERMRIALSLHTSPTPSP